MTIPAVPPLPGDDWKAWATQLRDYLLTERSKVGAATPTTPILRHKMGEESAASDGVLVFEPTAKRVQVSVDGAWETVTIDADLGTIASQDADDVAITGGSAQDLTDLSMKDSGLVRFVIETTGGGNADIAFYGASSSLKGVIGYNDGDGLMDFDMKSGDWMVSDGGTERYRFETDGGLNADTSIVRRVAGDARYVRQSSIGTTVQAYSATLSDIKDEDDMSSNSATALATQQSIKAYVDGKTIGGASWLVTAETSATRVGNTVYQNTNGNPILVVLTCRSSGSAGQFQLSNDNSTWVSISEVPASTEQERCIVCIVPDDWYYKTTVTLDTATDRWVEFK